MKWNSLVDLTQLEAIDRESAGQKVMIFKHSTRCSTSSTAKARVERNWTEGTEKLLQPYYLDLIAHRNVSNAIAERYGIEHESPQVLVILNGKCIFSQSHLDISVAEMLAAS